MAAHKRRDLLRLHPKDLCGGCSMDIKAGPECFLHGLVICDMRQHTQFNLTVIRIDEDTAVAGNKHPADLTAKFRADGNILQIWVCRGQAACSCDHVLECSVDTSVVGNLLNKAIRIGAFQLRHSAVIKDRFNDWMLALEFFKHICVC